MVDGRARAVQGSMRTLSRPAPVPTFPPMPAPLAPPDPVAPPPVPGEATPPVDAPRCANCGTAASDAYCPRCGQEQHDLHRSVRSIFGEALDSLAGWDGKIPATLWQLVRHPGALTTEFLAGRRVRYLRPLRLYLTLSLVYFLVLSIDWGASGRSLNVQLGEAPGRQPGAAARRDSLAEARVDSIGNARADSLVVARTARRTRRTKAPPDTTTLGGRIELAFERRIERLKQVPKAQRNRAFTDAFFKQIPNMVFALVPLVALLLRVAYRKSPLFYAEHLVHALHLHAFAMLALLVVHVTPGVWSVLPLLALPAYVWVALRRVYGGSRARTTVKLTLVLGGYLLALTIALSLMSAIIIFFFLGG
jgi:hypothetical protein